MSTQNLSSVAIHVVGQYNDAAKTLVGAYRAGAHRLLGGAASRYSEFLGNRQLPMVSDKIKTNLISAQEKVNGFLTNRLDIDTGRVVSVMDRMAAGTTSGIESVANAAARVEAPMVSTLLQQLTAFNLPVANLSAQIADRIAAGAKQIEVRVAGNEEAPVERTVKAKTQAAVKPVRRAVRKIA